jgi:predicted nucleic-acid-binding protein
MALDTNVLVRFLVRDDEKQAERVRRRLKRAEAERERLWIPLLVVLETIWVLESAYDKTRSDILEAIQLMRQMPIVDFEADDVVERLVLDGKRCRTDLADLLIALAAERSGCEAVLTFDKKATGWPLFRLLK